MLIHAKFIHCFKKFRSITFSNQLLLRLIKIKLKIIIIKIKLKIIIIVLYLTQLKCN